VTRTVRLDEIGKDDLALAGGEGANQGELIRAGVAGTLFAGLSTC
jgi:phosphoenolpyruvate synthase/pyruvate phosphate dikinase